MHLFINGENVVYLTVDVFGHLVKRFIQVNVLLSARLKVLEPIVDGQGFSCL